MLLDQTNLPMKLIWKFGTTRDSSATKYTVTHINYTNSIQCMTLEPMKCTERYQQCSIPAFITRLDAPASGI